MSRSSRSMSGTRPTADASLEKRLFDSGSSPRPRLLPCSVEIAARHMEGQSACASGAECFRGADLSARMETC